MSKTESDMSLNFTDEQKRSIEAVIANTHKIKLDQEALKEDIDAVANKIGIKAAELKSLVTLVISEREKGGVIDKKEQHLELAKQLLNSNESG